MYALKPVADGEIKLK